MKLAASELRQLADTALAAATDAGQLIAGSPPTTVEHKAGGPSLASQVVTEIDRASEAIILDHLAPSIERFELGLLTEERDDDGSRLTADYFWSVDPLDGTLPFIEGIPGYAVSIALVARNGTPVIGVVVDPSEATVLHAIRGDGAFRNGRPFTAEPLHQGEQLSVFADRSLLTMADHDTFVASLERVSGDLALDGIDLQATRGGVMNACGVLTNPPACYLKVPRPSGGGSLWDFAATACLFHEARAVATDMGGWPLDLNRADSTFMNHRGVLFATDERLASLVRDVFSG